LLKKYKKKLAKLDILENKNFIKFKKLDWLRSDRLRILNYYLHRVEVGDITKLLPENNI
jgi:hypothetical protein